jgi:hypothetical protein
MDYKEKAIACVKGAVLTELRRQFEECACSLDEQFKRYGDTDYFFATILEPGHVYEMGYPRCLCPDVESGQTKDPALCECSRQSILYVLGNLVPDKDIQVEIRETVLGGAEKCRFKVTVK